MEKITEIRTRILCKRINEKVGKEICKDDLASVLDNLEYLLETKQVDGVEQKYLPLQIKQEVFRLIYPNGYIHSDVEMNFKERMAMAKVTVYADSKGELTLGEGIADQMISLVPIFDSSDAQIQACRRLAKGRAASDALRDAGIASWFPDDPMFYAQVDTCDADNTAKDVADTKGIVTEMAGKDISDIGLPFDNDKKDPIRAFVLQGGKYPDTSLGDVEEKDPGYLIKLYTAYKDGRWPDASSELITNLETMFIQNIEHRFDEPKIKYKLG